jgi:cytochrome c biogenesis protein CcmG/thiol:disulfide interchange protein DsbE
MHTHAVISRLAILWGLLLCADTVTASPLKYDWLKVGSKVYSNVTVVGANTTDLYFTHNQGIANVKLKYVDETLRAYFNYDPKLAEAAEREQTELDHAYQGTLVARITAQAQKAALAAKKATNTFENSLADPVSDLSLLGKAAPPLDAEKWLGEKPVLKGKFVLVIFWAPWSIPCRKLIPQMNSLQKKFADRLVVVGITSDTKDEVDQMTEPVVEFASGIDTKAKMSIASGATSIPYALLLDAKGIVRYQGHPGALDEKKVETLLPKVE